MKLTKRIVDSAKVKEKNRDLWDSQLKGFDLRVYVSGMKSYMIQYRANNRTRKLTLSKYGILTPDEAKTMAKGGNPTEDKRVYSETPRLSILSARFMEEHVKLNCKLSTIKEY